VTFAELKDKAHQLPLLPGVYMMHDKDGNIIYVGKAKALKNRVSQYFADLASHSVKTRQMVRSVDDFEVIFSKTEFDALLLENTLIKKYKPKYNILLKDDKGYPFIRLEKGEYPRFTIQSRRSNDGCRYFGPYGGRGTANSAIRLLSEVFCLPTCSRQFPRDIGKERPCLRHHLKKCVGVCTGRVTPQQYAQHLQQAIMLLEGKGEGLQEQLQQEMESCAEALEFEKAAQLRDRLQAIDKLRYDRVVISATGADHDVLGYAVRDGRSCIVRLSYVGGTLVDRSTAFFEGLGEQDASDALESFIKQYYGLMQRAPKAVYLSHAIEEQEALEEYLSAMQGRKCTLAVPQRGNHLAQVRLALDNGALELAGLAQREERSGKTMELLAEMLGLQAPPQRMEAYDISNTAGTDAVASMTVFEKGKPLKKAYKKYKIKQAAAGDDYGAMAEVLGRRLDRALAGDENFLPLPDLLLIDGGAGQVSAVLAQLQARGLHIPMFGMVKDGHHRTRALVDSSGGEIGISTVPAVFALIGRIQEETHRFAVEFHRDVRSRSVRRSVLEEIPGVGDVRRKQLLKHFGTVKAIRAADREALCACVPEHVADSILAYFKEKSK